MQINNADTATRKKTVLIIENHEAQRLALQKALTRRGFRVESAGNVATSRALTEEIGKELDVMVLDMRLEDPEAPNITGAELGIEVFSKQVSWPPEFLINSAYEEVDYYRLALRLGAAAYLRKEQMDHYRLIRHVRVLSLRRALSLERPDLLASIRNIAETSRSQSEAIVRFCNEVLAPEFDQCLGAPFAVLLTDNEGTRCCASNVDIPEGPRVTYETLQTLAQGRINSLEPFVLDTGKLKETKDHVEWDILKKFEGAAFLPPSIRIIRNNRDIHLSVAILRDDRDKNPLAEDPIELAKVLAQYLRSTVLEHMLYLLSQWGEIPLKRKIAVLNATAQFCLYVGQQQEAILSESIDLDETQPSDSSQRRLFALASDLRHTGEMLITTVGDDAEPYGSVTREELYRSVHLAEIIRLAAEEFADQLPEDAISIQGDCLVQAIPGDLYFATSRLLQWFANRAIETSHGILPLIRVVCVDTYEGPKVIFEDQSRRLSSLLRQQLFDPFTQFSSLPATSGGLSLPIPLYLAKTLVEMRNGGVLEDLSNEVEGEAGHRFVMRFPPSKAAVDGIEI